MGTLARTPFSRYPSTSLTALRESGIPFLCATGSCQAWRPRTWSRWFGICSLSWTSRLRKLFVCLQTEQVSMAHAESLRQRRARTSAQPCDVGQETEFWASIAPATGYNWPPQRAIVTLTWRTGAAKSFDGLIWHINFLGLPKFFFGLLVVLPLPGRHVNRP